uniref:Odorant binding protein n=1 Tax=Athetis dissimilis TaxID=1737331 RepID=A0A4D6Q5X1_ATHDI|nr:odorant binding protein [Athetis dissimilis]
MSDFTSLVLCVVVVNLSIVYADDTSGANREDVQTILRECSIEYGVSEQSMNQAAISQDVTTVDSCFWACALKKTGFLTDKGEYDMKTGMMYVKQVVPSETAYKNLEDIAKLCEIVKGKPVNDGEAGCEKGAQVVDCFLKQMATQRKMAGH